jgi:hypothetical protein
MQWRKKLHQIDSLDSVLRMLGAPRFLQSRRGGNMSGSSGNRRNQYTHKVPEIAVKGMCVEDTENVIPV